MELGSHSGDAFVATAGAHVGSQMGKGEERSRVQVLKRRSSAVCVAEPGRDALMRIQERAITVKGNHVQH